ncbi:hypothetical protein ES703_17171 [subsurface metagenome]
MTSEERNDIVLDQFKRIGSQRWSDGIDPPNKIKDSIMTLTNNTRDIETLANDVVHHVDRREYEQAHCMLDNIERKVHEVRRHIEHLQNVRDFCARPAGD